MADGNVVDVVFRAAVGELTSGMAQAKSSVAAATADIRNSVSKVSSSVRNLNQEMQDLKRIDAVIDGNVKSFKELADAERALDRLMKANLLTSEMQEQAFKSLDTAEQQLTNTKVKHGAAVEDADRKTVSYRSNIQSVITNGMLGQWEGFTSAVGTLGINMASAGSAAALAVGGFVVLAGAIVAVVAGAIAGSLEMDKLNRAIETSGNVTGQTAESMKDLASSLAGGSVSIGEATDAIEKMVASGKYNAETLELGASAAANFARVTGMSMDEAASKIASLGDDPKKAVIDLNEQFAFLTVEQYNTIKALQETQGEAAAMAEALRILDAESAKRAKNLAEHAGWVSRAWDAVVGAVSRAKAAIMNIGVASASKEIEELTKRIDANNRAAGRGFMTPEQAAAANAQLQRQVQSVKDRQKAEAESVKTQAAWAQAQKESVSATAYIDRVTLSYDKQGQKVAKLTELQRQFLALRKTAPGDARLEGVVWDDKTKMPVSGGAYGKAAAGIEEDYAEKTPAAKKGPKGPDPAVEARRQAAEAARAAREAAQEEMTALAIRRDATRAAGEERLAIDQKIVERAKALYGENSSQYRSALNQMEADKRAQADRLAAIDQIAFDKSQDLERMKIEEAMSLAQRDYQRGVITAGQLLAIQKDLIEQKLALEVAYYERKKAIAEAGGDDVGAANAAAAIEVAQATAMMKMRESESEFQAESAASWQQWGDTIAGSMAQLAQNMIFQGMSFRDAFVNVLGGLLNQFIGFCGNMLSKWITTKLAEVAANTAANTAKVASDKLAAKESILANAGAAIKKILANGAEVFTSVYKAIAGIPYVGPFLAPVMAVAAGAAVVGMVSKVASAEKGWERVPADGMITELHKDEQVLPAEYAEGLRSLVANGGKQGGGVININTLDARSVKRFFQDNSDMLAGVLGADAGNFRFEG